MGMKWGVRKDGKPQGYQSSRKAKKSIKKAVKSYRKSSGVGNTTGTNMAKIDKRLKDAYSKDAKVKQLRKESNEAERKSHAAYKLSEDKLHAEDYASRKAQEARQIYDTVSDSKGASASQKLNAKRDYEKTIAEHEKAIEDRINAEHKYDEARAEYYQVRGDLSDRKTAIAKTFREEQLNAAVKDLGFDDIQKGRDILKEYDLEDYVLNPNYSMRLFSNGVRD